MWMGDIRVEQSKIFSTDGSCQALYISLVLKYPLERCLARAGREGGGGREGEKEKKKNGTIPRRTGCSNAKGNSHVTEKIDPFRIFYIYFFFFFAASLAPFPFSLQHAGSRMVDGFKKSTGEDGKPFEVLGKKTQRLDKNEPLS